MAVNLALIGFLVGREASPIPGLDPTRHYLHWARDLPDERRDALQQKRDDTKDRLRDRRDNAKDGVRDRVDHARVVGDVQVHDLGTTRVGRLTLEDKSGDRIDSEDYDPAPFASPAVSIQF